MKRLLFFLLPLALSAGAVSDHAQGPSPVTVFLNFDAQPSSRLLSLMQDEVSQIMGPTGLTFTWRVGGTSSLGETFADLIVLRFRGNCVSGTGSLAEQRYLPASSFSGAYSPEAEAAALASTATDGDRVLPFAAVECNELRRFVNPSVRPASDPDLIFGRALGRVVAHEMYHILAATKTHGRSGIAQRSYRRADLLAPLFSFDSRESEILRNYAGTLVPRTPLP